jgi:hypothetical protein
MGHTPTVEFRDVVVLRETALALTCRIAGQIHSLALGRLQPGTTVKHAGDRGVLVLTRDFTVEIGLERRPRARCAGLKRDGLACGATPRTGSRFCFAHEPGTAAERRSLDTAAPANELRRSRCESPRSDGRPCRAAQRPGVVFCYTHDPATAEKRKVAEASAVAAREARAQAVRERRGELGRRAGGARRP